MEIDPNGLLVQGFILLSGVIGHLYVSRMNTTGFKWWLASNVVQIAVAWHFKAYGTVLLLAYFSVMAIYSIHNWKKLQAEHHQPV
jgi:nicotinamide riboside transporter PnuC